MKNIELMREYMRLVEAGEKEPWKHFEVKCIHFNSWFEMPTGFWFTDGGYDFRLKPKTININGFEVPEPVREPLPVNSDYFIVNLYNEPLCIHRVWHGDESDAMLLISGAVHKTKEDATKYAKALLSFTEVKHDN